MDVAKHMLNLIAATRLGHWYLFLETLRDIIHYTFAYSNIKYSRYLTVMLCEMLSLETNYPEVYQQFVEGNFIVRLSGKNTFGRMEPGKVNNILIPKAIVM